MSSDGGWETDSEEDGDDDVAVRLSQGSIFPMMIPMSGYRRIIDCMGTSTSSFSAKDQVHTLTYLDDEAQDKNPEGWKTDAEEDDDDIAILRKMGTSLRVAATHSPASIIAKQKLGRTSKISMVEADSNNSNMGEIKETTVSTMCTRCNKDASKDKCEVPHPPYLHLDMGGLKNNLGYKTKFECVACFKVITTIRRNRKKDEVVLKGPKFCFNGEHTTQPLPDSDQRKIQRGLVMLWATGDLQAKIEAALTPEKQDSVNILCFPDLGGTTDIPVSLSHRMNNLTTLHLMDLKVKKLHLTQELTPKLTDLEIRSMAEDCDFKVVVPTLKNVSIQFYTPPDGDSGIINDMLFVATKLERFDSYKLFVQDELRFASNHLETIDLHRSENLFAVSIWAPNLKHLDLRACYHVERVKILKYHPVLSKELLSGSLSSGNEQKMSTFKVNTIYSNLSAVAKKSLKKNGRCVIKDVEDDNNEMAPSEESIQEMQRKVILPPYALRLKERGNFFFKANQFEKALSCYSQALDDGEVKHKDAAIIYKNKAAVYLKMGKNKEAIDAASLCLSITPDDPKALFRRAQGYENIGNLQKAFEDVADLVNLDDPNHAAAKVMYNRLFAIMRDSND